MSLPVDVTQIKSAWWSVQLGQVGAIVEDVADVGQALNIILTTIPGEDPHRPEFGANIYQYVDYPIDQATPLLVGEIYDAVERWEPRIRITDVRVFPATTEIYQSRIEIDWVLADGASEEFTSEVRL